MSSVEALSRIRKAAGLLIAIGFAMHAPSQVAEAGRIANAAVISSALFETLSHQ